LVEATVTPSRTPLGQAVIDCDIHNAVPSVQALFPYLSEHWREYITQSAFKGPTDSDYPKDAPIAARPDATPPGGGPPGSDLAMLRQQVLDPWGIAIGILSCAYAVERVLSGKVGSAGRRVNEGALKEGSAPRQAMAGVPVTARQVA